MAWQCSPKIEEMSEWFQGGGGEPESKADTKQFKDQLNGMEPKRKPERMKPTHPTSEDKPPEDVPDSQAQQLVNCIVSASRKVLQQNYQEIVQLLQRMDGQGQHCCPDPTSLLIESLSSTEAGSSPGSDRNSDSEKQWKRSLRSDRKRRPGPVSPGLVTRTQSKLQERAPDGDVYGKGIAAFKDAILSPKGKNKDPKLSETEDAILSPKGKDKDLKLSDGAEDFSVAGSVVETPAHAKDLTFEKSKCLTGRVRLRITPQHFSHLGTSFRDVQVDFEPLSLTVRALDMEGYAWTAFSKELPGPIVVDQCKFKLDPYGKEVTILLCKAQAEKWNLCNIKLTRPYTQAEAKTSPSLENFI
ncbi:unnamed protein product [Effrenium voratum]|nr:unnamed protein product [Effrenium voratum]